MFRLWGKIYQEGRIIKDIVIENRSKSSKEEMTDAALTEICMLFDLQKPMWLQDNEKDYAQFGRTLFKQAHFIESIDFDALELELIEYDEFM